PTAEAGKVSGSDSNGNVAGAMALTVLCVEKGGPPVACSTKLLLNQPMSYSRLVPPRTDILPSPVTSQAKPRRGLQFLSDDCFRALPPGCGDTIVRMSDTPEFSPSTSFGTVLNSYRSPRLTVRREAARMSSCR